jgi:hypothetical protein
LGRYFGGLGASGWGWFFRQALCNSMFSFSTCLLALVKEWNKTACCNDSMYYSMFNVILTSAMQKEKKRKEREQYHYKHKCVVMIPDDSDDAISTCFAKKALQRAIAQLKIQ